MMFTIDDRCRLGEQVNDPRYERIQILRAATGAKIAVSNELLIEPCCPGIYKIVANAWPTRQSSPFEQASGREHPRTMTQARNRLFLAVKCSHELARFLGLPEKVGVDKSSWHQQRIVVIRVRLLYRFCHVDTAGGLVEVDSANAALAQRYDVHFCAGEFQRLHRNREFHL